MGQKILSETSTIAAVSTPRGVGGIAVVRLSGPDALEVLSRCWRGSDPLGFESHTAHLGWITDSSGEDIDQVVATVFQAPRSYTGENVVEISCHGSLWVQQAVLNRLIECGASAATAGEFTKRAFVNGRIDLAQADGIADMIAASSKAGARLAARQIKGELSKKLEELRKSLLDLGVLLELELDFSEEDVEFADRKRLVDTATELKDVITTLSASYKSGQAFKNGVPVVIAGVPNAGKSTLLNTLTGDEKAIVSDIPGTTRDVIEDTVEIDGILFRFIDTAGLRDSDDTIEQIGVDKANKKISDASIVLYLIDPTQPLQPQIETLKKIRSESDAKVIVIKTKSDISDLNVDFAELEISSLHQDGTEVLKRRILEVSTSDFNPENELIVTNARHYEALRGAIPPLERLISGLRDGISADFLSQELREAERYVAEITGKVTSEEILHSIFERYCIGK